MAPRREMTPHKISGLYEEELPPPKPAQGSTTPLWATVLLAVLTLLGTLYNGWMAEQSKAEVTKYQENLKVQKDIWQQDSKHRDAYLARVAKDESDNARLADKLGGKYWSVDLENHCSQDQNVYVRYQSLTGSTPVKGPYLVKRGSRLGPIFLTRSPQFAAAQSSPGSAALGQGPNIYDVSANGSTDYLDDVYYHDHQYTLPGAVPAGFLNVDIPQTTPLGSIAYALCSPAAAVR